MALSMPFSLVVQSIVMLLGVGLVYTFANIISRRCSRGLSRVPGPFWGSVTSLYSAYVFWKYDALRQQIYQRSLFEKYKSRRPRKIVVISLPLTNLRMGKGPLVRYQPNLVMFSDPNLLPNIYRSLDKTDFYTYTTGARTGFTVKKHKEHAEMKRHAAKFVRVIP